MHVQRKSWVAGFTLAEVMISLAIFLIASMGLLPLLLANLQANQGNGLQGQARRLAGDALAVLEVADYPSLPGYDLTVDRHGAIELLREVESETPATGQTRLTVTANWRQQGQRHRYQLQSIRSAP